MLGWIKSGRTKPSTVQGQGGGQAIEDGAAMGILLDQVKDTAAIENKKAQFPCRTVTTSGHEKSGQMHENGSRPERKHKPQGKAEGMRRGF